MVVCLVVAVTGCVSEQPSPTPSVLPGSPMRTSDSATHPSTPPPRPEQTGPQATPTSAASLSPTQRPIATPLASPLEADDAITQFLSAFAWSPPPFHVKCSIYVDFLPGSILTHDPQLGSILVEGDTNGFDFAGWYASFGETTDVTYVGGVGYTRVPPADWEQPVGFELAIYPNPFFWLLDSDIEHLGVVSRVGRRLHHMKADWFAGQDPAEWMTDSDWLDPGFGWTELRDIELDSSRFEFYVRDDGMPVEAVLEVVLRGTAQTEDAKLTLTYTYIFTRHREEVTIQAPDLGSAG